MVDGAPLDVDRLAQLRRETAWVDPSVRLWNRSLLENLLYGSPWEEGAPIGQVIAEADLRSVLDRIPDGLMSTLGEGCALVSGGEGQRVRLGRALIRTDARLAVLDEPFRGLDLATRRVLLARARRWWAGATMICVTHDVAQTLSFPRVLVVEGGRIVEDGVPIALAAMKDSRYRALLRAEDMLRSAIWRGALWRRIRMEEGRRVEGPPKAGPDPKIVGQGPPGGPPGGEGAEHAEEMGAGTGAEIGDTAGPHAAAPARTEAGDEPLLEAAAQLGAGGNH
jgi:ATP-binding cassette subfamily B protein